MKQLFSSDFRAPISPWVLGVVVSLLVGAEATMIAGEISESSLTELAQESLLLTAAIMSGVVAWRFPAIRSLMVLFTGLLGCMLIRELDALFDNVFHGFWLYPALLFAGGAILYTMRCPKMGFRQCLDLVKSPSFRWLNFGLLTVLVISRIVGSGSLWRTFIDDQSVAFLTKNAVQEGTELWGYALIATGTWCVLLRLQSREESRYEIFAFPEAQRFNNESQTQYKKAA